MLQRAVNIFSRIFADQRGSAIPMIAVGMTAMVGAMGAAVDMGRVHITQARLSQSLDAAGLAAGAAVNSSDPEAIVTKYMSANFTDGFMGAELTAVTVTVSEDNTTLDLHAEAELDATFMKIFGYSTLTVMADSEITRTSRGMELVLVMDVTGSMNSSGKLTAMKDSANDLIDILFGDNASQDDLWVGIVPFSQTVNVGTQHADWTNSDTFNWGPTSWEGCVDARHLNGRDVTDETPSVEMFEKYYWPDDGNNNWISTSCSWWGGCSTSYNITSTKGPNKYCPEPITPLTNQKATLTSAINALSAGGNTHVGYGAVWGWRLISPNWNGLWGGDMDTNNLPLAYETPLMDKVMILLTDGQNTHSNNSHTSYWYLSDGRLGTTTGWEAEDELDDRLDQVCTSMKGNGVIIYTIAFGSPGSSIEALMASCASNPDYYFDSPTNAELQTAFQIIGDSLSNLRISQ